MGAFSRTTRLLGQAAVERLAASRVALFGVGGVGGFAAEALGRAGVGAIDLVDSDIVVESNINRQIVALHSTIGMEKVAVMRDRLLDIHPACVVTAQAMFLDHTTAALFDFRKYDFVLDAVDMVTAKLLLVERCRAAGTSIVSCMGAGNKLHADFEVTDIYKTSGCPLAKVMRHELRKRGIPALRVVSSRKQPIVPQTDESVEVPGRRQTPGSISFAPAVAGMLLAAEAIQTLVRGEGAADGTEL
ncbi:MAG: tRNA threonylcarbamoyladenosine dehydratase [Oscillospiraceae bacterium]|jgi:tRNA A37 threonylcarbamoyladenosine dehydratase|nr:tRNA threonylcarbamoyladenosine dehydratase [Oscillospiraceae bacterium]